MAGILNGKVALITGAGSGIGRATSKIFAREGAKLILADVVEEGGQETLRMLKDIRQDRRSEMGGRRGDGGQGRREIRPAGLRLQ